MNKHWLRNISFNILLLYLVVQGGEASWRWSKIWDKWVWGKVLARRDAPNPPVPCAAECDCRDAAVMHCAHKGLKAVPRGLPHEWREVLVLHLENNSITWLARDAMDPFPSLREVHLCQNKLRELDLGVFGRGSRMLGALYAADNAIGNVYWSNGEYLPLLGRLELSRNDLHHPPDAEALRAVPALLELHLGSNPLFQETEVNKRQESKLKHVGPIVSLNALRVLDLSDTGLAELWPAAFGGVPQLEFLNLANNSLTTLGTGVNLLMRLVQLDVSHNAIQTLGKDELPRYNRLQYIWLVGNPLKGEGFTEALEGTLASVSVVDVCDTELACQWEEDTKATKALKEWRVENGVSLHVECRARNASIPATDHAKKA